jgi:hypothetical protein
VSEESRPRVQGECYDCRCQLRVQWASMCDRCYRPPPLWERNYGTGRHQGAIYRSAVQYHGSVYEIDANLYEQIRDRDIVYDEIERA